MAKKSINDKKGEKSKEQIQDVSQTKELVKALSAEIGTLVEQFLSGVYNLDVAEGFADSIIRVYNKLRSEGITKKTAEKIICEYSANLDRFASMLKTNNK